ncbi:MAG: LegC family aminotransferase [Ignavibacteriales bacterium]|nr:LegC family aminotransferase [Ignavibacteriales bacterium]MBK7981499.1 LegC family aminotransferase [Ignavibacteriota bacterium]
MIEKTIKFIKQLYNTDNFIALHSPVFIGNEKKYLNDCIDSTFVSYIGKYVTKFEEMTAKYTGSNYAIAVVNGTTALQIALNLLGVEDGDEVITQPLTFVATANAIKHAGGEPVFVDVDIDTLGMSPNKLEDFLKKNCEIRNELCYNKYSKKKIKAIVPMHTFGFPVRIKEIISIANKYHIKLVEDSAESLGSFYEGQHTGTFGEIGILSYNGNKVITTGGGGIILTNNKDLAQKAKHITTTAKIPHKWEYVHDMVAYNYRMTNVTAALGVAQMENLNEFLENKRKTAEQYDKFFTNSEYRLIKSPLNVITNNWLNTIQVSNKIVRDEFLEKTNNVGIMTRPVWQLMNKLEMFKNCFKGNLDNSVWLADRLVNIPSGFRK